MSEIKYRPEIDGLRTIAVIPVVLFHVGFSWIDGGYFGVDVFFVISGFLISTIILKNTYSGSFSFKDFWMRRVRRIVPALVVMVLITLLSSYFMVFKPFLLTYGHDALSANFSYANFAMLIKFGDYWGSAAESSPFLHCWSLSLEEQFYVLYPLFIFLLYKYKISIFKSLLTLTVLSFAFFLYAAKFSPTMGFYMLPTRAWELAAGCIISYWNITNPIKTNKSFVYKLYPLIGLLLILSAFFFFTGSGGIGLSAVLPVIGSVLIIRYAHPSEFVGKTLAHPAMVAIGKISYSLYLWHWPIIVLARQLSINAEISKSTFICVVLISAALCSTASYWLVEKPTRTKKDIFKVVIPLAIAVIIVCLFYITPLINPAYNSPFEQTVSYNLYYDISPNIPPASTESRMKRLNIIAPTRNDYYRNAYAQEGIPGGDTTMPQSQIIVVGDSHGAMWGKQIDEIGKLINKKVAFYTMVGSNPLFNISSHLPQTPARNFTSLEQKEYQKSLIASIEKSKPCLIILCCKWDIRDLAAVKDIVSYAQARDVRVLIINQPPMLDLGNINVTQYLTYRGYRPEPFRAQYLLAHLPQKVRERNAELLQLTTSSPNCSILDIHSLFAKDDSTMVIYDKKVLYFDDDHLTFQGTTLAKTLLINAIQGELKKMEDLK